MKRVLIIAFLLSTQIGFTFPMVGPTYQIPSGEQHHGSLTIRKVELTNDQTVIKSGNGKVKDEVVLKAVTPALTSYPQAKAESTTKTPVKVSMQSSTQSSGDIQTKICAVFGSYCEDALKIAKHESGFNPNASSPTNDHGVFQINAYWQRNRFKNINDLYDVDINIKIAKAIFDDAGHSWRAWSTCKYLTKCY